MEDDVDRPSVTVEAVENADGAVSCSLEGRGRAPTIVHEGEALELVTSGAAAGLEVVSSVKPEGQNLHPGHVVVLKTSMVDATVEVGVDSSATAVLDDCDSLGALDELEAAEHGEER